MEYLDILNKNGEKTGEIKDRKEVHNKGFWHRGFHVWVINWNHEILLQRRSSNKDIYPNKLYASVAGHPISNEDELKGIEREFAEEIGIEINREKLEYLFTFSQEVIENDGKFIDNMFYDVYLLEQDINLNDLILQEDEVSEVKYLDFKVFEKMIENKDRDIVNHPEEWKKLFEILHKKYE